MEEKIKNTNIDVHIDNVDTISKKKRKFPPMLRAALVCLVALGVITGVIYPLTVTLVAQTVFPYEANGSIIEVETKDGTKIFGSELIGQNYESPIYLFGRVNLGAGSNLSPESDEFNALVKERVEERKAKLATIGYADSDAIPDELLTASGSGLDPHISVETAYFQIPAIVKARESLPHKGEAVTKESVKAIIDKYTEGRFLGVFGTKRVNVLLVNLALDGEI